MQHTGNGKRVCEELAQMPSCAVIIDRRKPPGVPENVPVGEGHCFIIANRTYNDPVSACYLHHLGSLPGSLNSVISRPLLKSCSSSLTSRRRSQYFAWSSSISQCSCEQWVGQPQFTHSCATRRFVPCTLKHIGHDANFFTRSPLSFRSRFGDFESGWKSFDGFGALAGSFAAHNDLALSMAKLNKERRGV